MEMFCEKSTRPDVYWWTCGVYAIHSRVYNTDNNKVYNKIITKLQHTIHISNRQNSSHCTKFHVYCMHAQGGVCEQRI